MQTPPFLEGYKAYVNEKYRDENPYNDNPFMVFRSEWFKGWDAAYDEEQLFKQF